MRIYVFNLYFYTWEDSCLRLHLYWKVTLKKFNDIFTLKCTKYVNPRNCVKCWKSIAKSISSEKKNVRRSSENASLIKQSCQVRTVRNNGTCSGCYQLVPSVISFFFFSFFFFRTSLKCRRRSAKGPRSFAELLCFHGRRMEGQADRNRATSRIEVTRLTKQTLRARQEYDSISSS